MDRLKIGQFSKITGLTTRALRLYEEKGLLLAKNKDVSGYRYYLKSQVTQAVSIKKFKKLGFTLNEIKFLTNIDSLISPEKISKIMQDRLDQIKFLQQDLAVQESHLNKILESFDNNSQEFKPLERRYIMSHFNNVSVVVTGTKDLEQTAKLISSNLSIKGGSVRIIHWSSKVLIPEDKPYVLIVTENKLAEIGVETILPDVVVINNISKYSPKVESLYLRLFSGIGPHLTTVFNADDEESVKLAANKTIRSAKIFYHSINEKLVTQIQKIGGVSKVGSDIKIFGFNLKKGTLSFPVTCTDKNNIALAASLTAVLDVGLDVDTFNLPQT